MKVLKVTNHTGFPVTILVVGPQGGVSDPYFAEKDGIVPIPNVTSRVDVMLGAWINRNELAACVAVDREQTEVELTRFVGHHPVQGKGEEHSPVVA